MNRYELYMIEQMNKPRVSPMRSTGLTKDEVRHLWVALAGRRCLLELEEYLLRFSDARRFLVTGGLVTALPNSA